MASDSGTIGNDYSDFSADVDDLCHSKLSVQDRTFFVNAGLLADLSPVFKRLFFDVDMKENKDGLAEIIDESPDDMLELLQCLLQSSPIRLKPKPIIVSNFRLLVRLSVKFEITSLLGRCEHYILKKFRTEQAEESQLLGVLNAVDSFNFSDECRIVALNRAKNVSNALFKCYDFRGWDPLLVAMVTTAKLTPNESVLATVSQETMPSNIFSVDDYSDFSVETPFTKHKLIVENKTLFVNGAGLANRSAFFARMFFGGDFKEKTEQTVTIEEESHGDIVEMLQCTLMNSKTLKKVKPIAVDHCALLIRLADKFQFPSLTAACEHFVQAKLQQENATDYQLTDILKSVIMLRLSSSSLDAVVDKALNASTFPRLVRLAAEMPSPLLTTACEQFIALKFPSMTVSDQMALAMLSTAAIHQLSPASIAKLIDRAKMASEDVLEQIDVSSWPNSLGTRLLFAKIKWMAEKEKGRKHHFASNVHGTIMQYGGSGSSHYVGYTCSTMGCQYKGFYNRSVVQCTQCSKYFCNECMFKSVNCTTE